MYQVFCMKGTPPVTREEQERCFRSKTSCWRLSQPQSQTTEEDITTDESFEETEKGTRKRRRAS